MTYEEEIRYREELFIKIRNKIKLTPEERLWMETHPVYNSSLGYPFLKIAIETLAANKWYTLKVKLESIAYEEKIAPIIYVPASKGKILTDFAVFDFYGKESRGKPIQMLECELAQQEEMKVKYLSELGLLSVHYKCGYYDLQQKLYVIASSMGANISFAMVREPVNDQTVRYRCKLIENHVNSGRLSAPGIKRGVLNRCERSWICNASATKSG